MRATPFLLAACLSVQTVSAVSYMTGFEPPQYEVNNELADVAGQNGWVIDDPTEDISFFVEWPDSSNHGAAIGGFFDVPNGTSAELSRAIGRPLAGTKVSLDFFVQSSTNEFPGRDSFFFHIGDEFTLALEPSVDFADQFEVAWYDSANTRTSSGWDIFYDSEYGLDLEFSDSGFSATITGSEVLAFSGALPGAATGTFDHFGAGWALDPQAQEFGDNFLAFDNLDIRDVPEPALSSVVFAGVVGLLTVVRRRVGKKS